MPKWILLSLCLFGCTMQSKEDFELQAKVQIEKLSQELKSIHDLSELESKKGKLKKKFQQITDLMIAYQNFLEKHPERQSPPRDPLVIAAADLKEVLSDVLRIEGAEQFIIEIEKDSFMKLALMEESSSDDLTKSKFKRWRR